MNAKTQQNNFKVIGIVVVIAALLLGGIGITGAAAQSALPGDALYGVKTGIEQTRLSMARDAGDRAQMKLAQAEQRLTEISALVQEGRYREISSAVLAFESSINAAIMELETVSKSDPTRAAQIAQEVTAALTRYAQTLSVLAATAPDSVKSEVTRALDTTQIANGLKLPSADDNANVNSNSNDNADDNSNMNSADDNGNDNSAVDDHGNDNSSIGSGNTNSDDSLNANDNSNVNDNSAVDDHGNDNGSVIGNNNSDDHGTDVNNSNTNTNVNDNSSVDDNSNDSGGTNVNDNSGSGGNDNTGSDDNSGGGSGGGGSDDNSGGNDNGNDSSGKGG